MKSSEEAERKTDKTELIKFISVCSFALFFLGMLFYRNVIAALVLSFGSLYLKKYYLEYAKEKRKDRLLEAFRDVLYSLSGSVAAGRQLPQAVSDAAGLCRSIYGEDAEISRALMNISVSYEQSHSNVEDMLFEFGKENELDELMQFAGACRICRQCGGNIEEVCLKSAKLLLDRMEFYAQVKSLIQEKKLDIMLLTTMPILILLFLNLTNYSYISVLYSGLLGRLIMTLCLAMIIGALVWGLKIIRIQM